MKLFNNPTIFIKKIVSIIIIYILTLTIFKFTSKNSHRFILLCILLVLSCILLKDKKIVHYLLLGLCTALTESIFIIYLPNTWSYKTPEIFEIPYWLLPLWSIAILLLINVYTSIKLAIS